MPGVGDFNLTAFFRAMGIKNPAPSVRESVQPVIVVGQMGGLTPRYQNPWGSFGGNVVAVVAEQSFFQVTPASPGGCLIEQASCDSLDLVFGIVTRVSPATNLPATGSWSDNPIRAIVETGSIAVSPIPTATFSPKINTNTRPPSFPWYVPVGRTAYFGSPGNNQGITDFVVLVSDLPAAPNSTV